MKMSVKNVFNSFNGKTGLILRKVSPEILIVVGITGIVTATILACKSTLKVNSVINKHKLNIDKINKTWEDVKEGMIPLDEYSEMDKKRDLAVSYLFTINDFIKLYGPAVGLGIISITCIVGSHGIMKNRNIALMTAYKTIDEGFKAYRKRVIEEHGEEADYMYKHGLRSEMVNEVGEDGKKHKVSKMKFLGDDPNTHSPYARFFDEGCSQWTKTPEYNLMFLRSQQNYYNDLLKARGHVFLNEVYDALGINRSKAGAVVGWVISEHGDNYIDFGVFDGRSQRKRAFVNGDECSILLDFNVDGVIYDLI